MDASLEIDAADGTAVDPVGRTTARAGGLEIPGQGARSISRGAAIVALADDLTAMMNNPGGLSKLSGWHITLSYTGKYAPISFTRAPSGMEDNFAQPHPGDPLAKVEDASPLDPAGGFLGVAYGLDDWTFGLGVYGTNSVAKMEFPVNGGQRYLMTSRELLLLYYTLAVAYGQDDWGVGVTLQWAHLPVSKFTQVVDNNEGTAPQGPYYNPRDLEVTLDMSDPGAFTANLGGWYRPIDAIEIGLSARLIPVKLSPSGPIELTAIEGIDFAGKDGVTVKSKDATANLDIELPITVHGGIRYRHMVGDRELFDIELDYRYENWAVLERYEIDLEGQVVIEGLLDKPKETDLHDTSLEKRWADTHSVRLGGTYNVVDEHVWVSAGGFWESAAAPQNYSNIDFSPFERFGVGGGIRISGYGLDFTLAAQHIFSEAREVDELFGKQFQIRPLSSCPESCDTISGVVANAGKIELSYTQFSASLSAHFD